MEAPNPARNRKSLTRRQRWLLLMPYALSLLVFLTPPFWVAIAGDAQTRWLMFAGGAVYPLTLSYTAVLLLSLPFRLQPAYRALAGYAGSALTALVCFAIPTGYSGLILSGISLGALIGIAFSLMQSQWIKFWVDVF